MILLAVGLLKTLTMTLPLPSTEFVYYGFRTQHATSFDLRQNTLYLGMPVVLGTAHAYIHQADNGHSTP